MGLFLHAVYKKRTSRFFLVKLVRAWNKKYPSCWLLEGTVDISEVWAQTLPLRPLQSSISQKGHVTCSFFSVPSEKLDGFDHMWSCEILWISHYFFNCFFLFNTFLKIIDILLRCSRLSFDEMDPLLISLEFRKILKSWSSVKISKEQGILNFERKVKGRSNPWAPCMAYLPPCT